jgi:hypothetical protein
MARMRPRPRSQLSRRLNGRRSGSPGLFEEGQKANISRHVIEWVPGRLGIMATARCLY